MENNLNGSRKLQNRSDEVKKTSPSGETIYVPGGYEVDKIGSATRALHYIPIGSGCWALIADNSNSADSVYYILGDHLGSVHVITNSGGTKLKEYSFDPWGRRRNPTNWTYNSVPAVTITTRGFTMHEHMDQFKLINMNGRAYDPVLGQFISADPFIQDPTSSLNYNRYSYCFNNPLKYTDPSGYNLLDYLISSNNYDGGSFYYRGKKYLHCDGGGFINSDGDYVKPNAYYYSNGNYYNGNGQSVSYLEVQNNYIIPNSTPCSYSIETLSISKCNFKLNNPGSNHYNKWLDYKINVIDICINNNVITNNSITSFYNYSNNECPAPPAGGGGMTGIPESDAIKYGAAGISVWGSTVEAGFDAARVTQKTVSTWSKGARIMSRSNNVLTIATIGYDFSTGTANMSTLFNAGMNVTGAIVYGIGGAAVAPYVAGGLALYGIISIAGGDKWLNSHFDISNKINFVTPAATTVYRGPNGGYIVEGGW